MGLVTLFPPGAGTLSPDSGLTIARVEPPVRTTTARAVRRMPPPGRSSISAMSAPAGAERWCDQGSGGVAGTARRALRATPPVPWSTRP